MKQKVLLGLSGGVDSAVAAFLLKKQGYTVIGAFMRCFSENKNKITGDCNYLEDQKEARKIAALLKIDLVELNYEKEYSKQVIDYLFKYYNKGLTPNPDSLCNKTIKFPYLWKNAKKLGCDFIATGHYIKKIKKSKEFYLKIPSDSSKDQSYFLYQLNKKDLEHALFPIGDYNKSQIRQIAKKNKFPNWDKKGTKGLCFVGNINMKSFLKQKIKNKPGLIKNPEGKVIGSHEGIMFYTIGERITDNQQVSIKNEYKNEVKSKLYVAKKDIKKNILIIAPKGHQLLKTKEFSIKNLNWINSKPKQKDVLVRIRHLGQLNKATLNKNKITLKHPIEGVAEGQSAVIYTKGGLMLGGGEIRN